MSKISKLEFENITVLYNEETINKKLCKKKNRRMNMWTVVITLISFISMFYFSWLTRNLSEVISMIVMLITFLIVGFGGVYFTYWLVYHKVVKAFFFMEWLFRMKEVYAGWYNDKILLRVQHSNGIDDYSLQGFVRAIKNELVITDKSDRSKPIHIFVDITSNEKTEITIENVEK